MKALVIGSGGSASAAVWRLEQDGHKVVFAPGNASAHSPRPVGVMDFKGLADLALIEKVDFSFPTTEDPICGDGGITDFFTRRGQLICAPSFAAAEVTEGSKVESGYLVVDAGVASPTFAVYEHGAMRAMCDKNGYIWTRGAENIVVKAEGRAGGKGVFLPKTLLEIPEKCDEMQRKYKNNASRFVIQDRLYGPEFSMILMTDGETVFFFTVVRDHKRRTADPNSPNTGGMGGYTCTLNPDTEEQSRAMCRRIISQLQKRGIKYQGIMFVGFILTEEGPKVLEINCRGGDPEMQVILPSLSKDNDFGAYCQAMAMGANLRTLPPPEKVCEAVCVNLVDKNYPDGNQNDVPIFGIKHALDLGALVFHGATDNSGHGPTTHSAGRVLSIVGRGKTLEEARKIAYAGADVILAHTPTLDCRRDIAKAA